MSQNINRSDLGNQSTGGAGTGATDLGTTRDTHDTAGTNTSLTPSSSGTGIGTAPARAEGIAGQAQEYATQAKDYMSDKVSMVGDKIKDLQNKDFSQVTDEAKQYAREKPGQALLISAAAGFLIGLLLRNSRR
ncbi:MAG: hypothetical protein H0T45_11630 [Pyrinomonadaceae bacterium]|nr:hypothetical protein [Pyrinomonadaceae bacterium]